MEYIIHLLTVIAIYLPLTLGLNIVFGLGKLLNFSHVAMYGIGAYTTAILASDYGYSWYACMTASMLVASLSAIIIGLITKNLKEDYFIIGTVALASVIQSIIINWKELTRGVLGIPGIPRPIIMGRDIVLGHEFLTFCLIVAYCALALSLILFRSPLARFLRASGEFNEGAKSLGIDTGTLRYIAFIFSAALAGLSGSLYSYFMTYIDPSSFTISEMIFIVTVVVIGRPGSLWGTVLATAFLVLLPEPLRFVSLPSSILGPLRQMIYAVILFGVVYAGRKKIFPVLREI